MPRRLLIACVTAATCLFAVLGGTGMGATEESQTATANVLSSIILKDPVALDAANPACTPNTADTPCSDVVFTPGTPITIDLGELTGTEVQSGSFTWTVTTTSPTGYSVVVANTGAGAVLSSADNSIDDVQSTPPVSLANLTNSSQFGMAAGDPVGHNQSAVDFLGSPWGTTGAGGTQGLMFAGIPTAGVEVARRTTPQVDDPLTLTFAAASNVSALPAVDDYSGTIKLTATTI